MCLSLHVCACLQGGGAGVADLASQLSSLEVLLGQRDAEVRALQAALEQRELALAHAQGTATGSSGPGTGVEARLREQVRR